MFLYLTITATGYVKYFIKIESGLIFLIFWMVKEEGISVIT